MKDHTRTAPPRRVPGRLGALAWAALLAASCSGDAASSAGQALYEAQCQMCHGEAGLGDGPMASTLPVAPVSLIEHLAHHTRAELTRLVLSGIPPAMPPAAVSAEEIGLIVDYVWTLVPEDQVAALREAQRLVEESGQGVRQEFAFIGTVVQIDSATGIVAVQNEDIPGWMMSMTMTYSLQPPEIAAALSPGDRIRATVYAGDVQNLYEVERLLD